VMLNKLKHNIGGVTANVCSQVLQPTRTSTYVPTGTGTQIPSATQSFTD
jgi:hypothetical protein